ncbi:MAG: MBL fold metallo-hydrolase, partial [Cyanobacteria bacterium CAN_BIN43]|nr:MBL fold metallo-hydrolase [Cyanobacteria bacterium CAN_BIN43]
MSNVEDQFTVRFWGVRGSIACPGRSTVRYG